MEDEDHRQRYSAETTIDVKRDKVDKTHWVEKAGGDSWNNEGRKNDGQLNHNGQDEKTHKRQESIQSRSQRDTGETGEWNESWRLGPVAKDAEW